MQDLVPMLVSTVLGTLVGWERQMGRKPAGLRTHTLVCLGSTMFVLITRHAVLDIGGPSLDPTRVIHGVITGVGFLGAGSIAAELSAQTRRVLKRMSVARSGQLSVRRIATSRTVAAAA